MSPGDICRVSLPGPPGTEASRLAVLLQDPAAGSLPTVLVVPLTDRVEALRQPGAVAIDADPAAGLGEPRVALVFQITAVDAGRVHPSPGRISPRALQEIRAALARLTGAEG